MTESVRSVDWSYGRILIIDQTKLPDELIFKEIDSVKELIESIKRLEVRGAPSIGVAAAMGVVLAAQKLYNTQSMPTFIEEIEALRSARPTAVNLAKCVDRILSVNPKTVHAYTDEALRIRDEEIQACYDMGRRGADLLYSLFSRSPLRLMTICNTGGLAAVERGTALGVIQTVHEDGNLEEVFVMETRPLLQGARLTTWELDVMGIPYRLHVDSAGPALISQGRVDAVLVGADRITSDRHVANKIGTYSLALACKRQKIPFIVVAPESTFDESSTGEDVIIEFRSSEEVTKLPHVKAINPAFDLTPPDLITAIVSNKRVLFHDTVSVL